MRTILAASLLALASTAAAQKPDFTWSKALAAGSVVSVHNLNGDIRYEPASGNTVEVTAVKHGRADDIYVAVQEYAGGVAVCVLWHNTDESCDRDGAHMHAHRSWRDSDGSMDVTVRLPASMRADAHAVSGDISITGAQGDVHANSVSGDVRLRDLRASSVEARSVSGDVDVTISALTGAGGLRFRSVSGDVTVAVPQGLDADFSMSTVSGELDTDFPLTLSGGMGRRNIQARIGKGGRNLEVSTVSGDVKLRALK
jgi:hypothetical protein